MRPERRNREAKEQRQREAVATAQAILRRELGVIEGARRLSTLAGALVDDWASDPDLVVFGALDSSTDHLPVGPQRELWASAALAERDAEVARIQREVWPDVEAACRRVIARFAVT
jgi:hypothetical protein